jgi:putative chitinase
MSLSITDVMLKKFASLCDSAKIAPALDAACTQYAINTARQLTHFLGHVYHESGGFVRLHENLDYRAERLMEVWPKRFPTLQSAAPYAHNPPALANSVYAGRLGNTAPDDGWRYCGRGFIQI